MKKFVLKVLSFAVVLTVVCSSFSPSVRADEVTDPDVSAVITQLESIDSLQDMQDMRSTYKITKYNRYNVHTTSSAVITAHETARAEYETYVNKMFAARLAAQTAYDALTADQQAMIDPALVEKLDDTLDTTFRTETYTVTPRYDNYSFELVNDTASGDLVYETSNHATAGHFVDGKQVFPPQLPSTFVLVDTANGETSWTPNGRYSYGESNYDVAYCCDLERHVDYTSDYKRVNLEDSTLNSDSCSEKIRAIVQNSYPYISLDEMKAQLIANGLSSDYVTSLTRSDIIAAVQMAIWAYSNNAEIREGNTSYGATYDITANVSSYMNPLHDYTNELWDYWNTNVGGTSYDARAEYRVNTLVYYLCNLEGVSATENQRIVSIIDISRADLVPLNDELCAVGMYVHLNNGSKDGDNLTITATSYSENADGTMNVTNSVSLRMDERTEYSVKLNAKYGDIIKVEVNGTQYVEKGVYLYEAEGGYEKSQTLVGVSEGKTTVYAEKSFTFEEDIDMGLRIYKTATTTGLPLSDITFHIYNVVPEAGEELGETPTYEEIAKYATEENLVASVTTDSVGYAAIPLDKGTYLVVEEHNTEKVLKPVDPFYIMIPMPVEKEQVEGDTSTDIEIEYLDVVSVYPKNTPPDTPPPPPPPPPTHVVGKFTIIKHDAVDIQKFLSGAKFQVYRNATEDDTDTIIITCEGVEYAVAPLLIDGSPIVLTTDENGRATSPDLPCGSYFLVETKAPNGYNSMADAVFVAVQSNALTEVTTVYVPNEKGALLPETGGMGTTMLLMIGSIIIIGSAIFLLTKKRMQIMPNIKDDSDSFLD